jgi:hypothetical protein
VVEGLKKSVSVLKGVESNYDDECVIYSLPLTKVSETLYKTFKILNTPFSLSDLLKSGEGVFEKSVEDGINVVTSLVNCINEGNLGKTVRKSFHKRSSRFSIYINAKFRLSVTTERNYYLCMHYSPADLPFLSDFELFKNDLSIIQKSFITRGKGLKYKKFDYHVHVRDSALLAPGGKKRLADLGKVHSKSFEKIEIGGYVNCMKNLLRDDPKLFKEYAMQDTRIVLKHVNELSKAYFELGYIGVPITLSAMSSAYILKEWRLKGYKGYQLNPKYLIGDVGKIATPSGLRALGSVGLYLPFYTASYRGGRNESFMYGVGKGFGMIMIW